MFELASDAGNESRLSGQTHGDQRMAVGGIFEIEAP